jgi:hypothetical protein
MHPAESLRVCSCRAFQGKPYACRIAGGSNPTVGSLLNQTSGRVTWTPARLNATRVDLPPLGGARSNMRRSGPRRKLVRRPAHRVIVWSLARSESVCGQRLTLRARAVVRWPEGRTAARG